tara:strand:- start:440 stop:745 length:306 start_codon:yes stop_codon:yes gene_type:complete
MKLPDRLIAKWLSRHPQIDAWLESHLKPYSHQAMYAYLFVSGMASITYQWGWQTFGSYLFGITYIFMLTWMLLCVIWFLKREINRDIEQNTNDGEQDHAHP